MKKYTMVLACLILFAFSGRTNAQTALTEEQKDKIRNLNEMYREELNLDEKQSEKVRQINEEFLDDLNLIKQSNSSRFVKMRKLKELNSTRDQEMKTILNEDQYETFKEIREKTRAEFRKKRRG